RQYPIQLAYATTFNSCTLDKVMVDLRKLVFSHGQLYNQCLIESSDQIRSAGAFRPVQYQQTTENIAFNRL
ncbi:hypothetical protein BJ742DRAFT_665935, partial [Cladochytrium replicatum]